MKRTLIAVAALIGLASAANAATLTVVASQASYNVGDTITLTVTGDSQGASSTGIFGRLLFSGPTQGSNGATPTQTTLLALGSIPWLAGVTSCSSTSCDMFNQVGAFGASPAPASNLLVATVSFLAQNTGTVGVTYETNAATGFQLDFFGLSNAAGTSYEVVPEPTTAALLGLGLFGLAVAGRRRA